MLDTRSEPVSLRDSFDIGLAQTSARRWSPSVQRSQANRWSTALILQLLVAVWCSAIWVGVPPERVTPGLAAVLGLLFLLLLPFNRWACFLVLMAGCALEDALRYWAPLRFNTLHYAT